jgi:hypothetical protein
LYGIDLVIYDDIYPDNMLSSELIRQAIAKHGDVVRRQRSYPPTTVGQVLIHRELPEYLGVEVGR